MKKCPTCEKTFEDSMRFCQTDGTPLVEDAPAFDPYATVVASPGAAAPVDPATETVEPERIGIDSVSVELSAEEPSTPAISEPDEVLDLPEPDMLKTMYVSEDEMRAALGQSDDPDDPEMEIPPAETPEPPKFVEPEIAPPNFASVTPPPSPFAVPETPSDPDETFQSTNPPIPSPFDAAPPLPSVEPDFLESETMMQPDMQPFQRLEPETPPYMDPEPAAAVFNAPFEEQSAPVAEWTPPPAPEASWGNQAIGQNTPFQPPVAGTGGVNQTLPIVSLVLGIISLCCYVSPITGLAALITGFIGIKNANNDPQNFGGKGLAIAGMITGGLFFLVGLVYYIVVILIYAGVIAGSMLQGF